MADYKLPDVGEGLTEAEIVSWKVEPGDTIEVNDVVVEIETAKSLVELPSPYAGTVTELLVPEGETVAVGTPIIRIGAASDGATGTQEDAPDEAPAAAGSEGGGDEPIDTNVPPEGNSTLVGYGPREVTAKRRPRKGTASPSSAAGASTQGQVQGAFTPGGGQGQPVVEEDEPSVPAAPDEARAAPAEQPAAPAATSTTRALAKPPVRKLAKDLGVDLAQVPPTGPNGTVSRDDVQQAASQGDRSRRMPEQYEDLGRPGVGPMRGARETREPVKGVRKMMARAMVDSAFSAPHVTEWITLDVTGTVELLDRLRTRREFADLKLSPLLVLAKAAMLAMRRTPEVNSWWDEANQEVVHRGYVNLGIAAATPRGLVVPNIKDADAMSLHELAHGLGELTATAREGRTQPAEMSGGTFTITNVGVFGVDAGTPIINPGESAILCFGSIEKRPWVADSGEIVARDVTTLALSFDHRHIDGEKGSRYLSDVAAILRDPASALLF